MSTPHSRLASTLLILLTLVCSSQSLSQSAPEHRRLNGIPLYRIYEDKDIEDSSRGNFITSSPDNQLFFGNENGIHVFDGTSWNLVLETVASRDKIRSLHWSGEKIYAAGYNTIGTIEISPLKGTKYIPINDTPLSTNASEFYDKILENAPWLHFVGQRNIASYNTETGEIKSHYFKSWIGVAIVAGGNLYVTTNVDGILRLEGNDFVPLEDFKQFVGDDHIMLATRSPNGQFAFATENGKLYRIEENKAVSAYPNFSNTSGATINSIQFIDDRRLAVSIPAQGIVVLDPEGNTIASLNRDIDYRWSGARMLHTDQDGTLWAMLNTTVGKVLLDSPITPIDERLRPSVYYPIAHYFDNQLFLRTNGKLYQARHHPNGQLAAIENAMPDQPLSVSLALAGEDGLYIHAEGTTYLFADGTLTPLGSHPSIDRLTTFRDDPNLFLGISSSHAYVFKREGMTFTEIASTPHNAGLVNKIARDEGNVFWLEIGLGQVAKIWYENDALHYKRYGAEQGLPPDWIAIWEHLGKVLLTESTGVYQYDPESDRFEAIDMLEHYFPRSEGSLHRVCTDPKGNIWASYDNFNYILWAQDDGTYRKDAYSLSQLGELYINEFKFLPNGNVVLLTENEMYHVDVSNFKGPEEQPILRSELVEVSNVEGSTTYFLNIGQRTKPKYLDFNYDQNSVVLRFANTFSNTLDQPSFQYYLDGVSRDWSKWSTSNEFVFPHLKSGTYELRVRTRVGELLESQAISVPFKIEPALWQTPFAYAFYTVALSLLLLFGYNYFARNLKNANERLEKMVAERTREIESKNLELRQSANMMFVTLDELRSAQDQLMTTSRKAGMAEVATNVLHNVGNVLNSINIGVVSLADSLEHQRAEKLTRVVDLIEKHSDNLGEFFTSNPKGKAIPEYLRQLAQVLRSDFAQYQMEVDCMSENIDHVKKIITTQQAHAKTVEVNQLLSIPEVVESALTIIMGDPSHSIFEVTREFDDGLEIVSDKHRILQMLANFVKNAKEAIKESNAALGLINITGRFDEERKFVTISVKDNGIGISPENLKYIFNHGFTTKEDGHGFGMHSCSNSAKVLGGSLSIDSEGLNKGATVILTLPVAPPQKRTGSMETADLMRN